MGKDLNDVMSYHSAEAVHPTSDLIELLPEGVTLALGLKRRAIDRIACAALNPDRFEAEEALRGCLDDGISAEALIDKYIPQVASLLGEGWCRDRIGFSEVTIGVARLQGHVRMLDQRVARVQLPPDQQPSVLLIVTPNCYHTLGPMIALSQFRRLGASVRLLLAQSGEEVSAAMASEAYDLVALAATAHESLDSLRLFVDIVRTAREKIPPIVVGGSILDVEPDTHILVGADHATRDPYEALSFCGLTIKTSGASSCAAGG